MRIVAAVLSFLIFISYSPAQEMKSLPNGYGENNPAIEVSVISPAQAAKLFQAFVRSGIRFGCFDGCEARATAMTDIADKKHITMGRVNSYGRLQVDKTRPNGIQIQWRFHVAPMVFVEQDDIQTLMVFDPSLFDRPVTEAVWNQALLFSTNDPNYIPEINGTYYGNRFQYRAAIGRSNHFPPTEDYRPTRDPEIEQEMRYTLRTCKP